MAYQSREPTKQELSIFDDEYKNAPSAPIRCPDGRFVAEIVKAYTKMYEPKPGSEKSPCPLIVVLFRVKAGGVEALVDKTYWIGSKGWAGYLKKDMALFGVDSEPFSDIRSRLPALIGEMAEIDVSTNPRYPERPEVRIVDRVDKKEGRHDESAERFAVKDLSDSDIGDIPWEGL